MKICYTWNIDLIDNYIKSKNLYKTQFCKQCDISPYFLRKFYSGNLHIKISVWLKIANFLHVNPLELLKRIDF